MLDYLTAKLHPDRFNETSGRMVAISGYALAAPFTEPALSQRVATPVGLVPAQMVGEAGANEMIGARADLNRNLITLNEAGFTAERVEESGRPRRPRVELAVRTSRQLLGHATRSTLLKLQDQVLEIRAVRLL
ncbi:MAG: hypothetical protein FJ038_06555 [Chloroflexi bacterium]|nr:hypothetical protein [Chloroflexota bacterium]